MWSLSVVNFSQCVKLAVASQFLHTHQGTLGQCDTNVEVIGLCLEWSVWGIQQIQYLMCHTGNELEAVLGNGLQNPCGLNLNLCATGLGAFDLTKQVKNVARGFHDHCTVDKWPEH